MTESGRASDTSFDAPASVRLDSWKEIAGYLRRDERTVRRWEKSEGLPVHRHFHEQRASVFAYPAELDAWLKRRQPTDSSPENPVEARAKWPERGRHARRPTVFQWVATIGGVVVVALFVQSLRLFEAPPPPADSYRILVVDPGPATEQPETHAAVRHLLERELVGIPGLDVVVRDEFADTLRLMRRPPGATIDAATAHELAVRRGDVDGLLGWRIEQSGETQRVAVLLSDPAGRELIAGWHAPATAGVAPAVPPLARRIAQALPATLGSVGQHPDRPAPYGAMEGMRLEDATTASFEAWRLYADAMTLHFGFGWRQSAELLERAVAEDPEFATAHVFLGRAYTSLGQLERARSSYVRAFRLANTVTDRERYFIRAAYFQHVLEDPTQTTHAYSTLLLTHPDHYWGVAYATWFHIQRAEMRQVAEYQRAYAEARPDHLEMTIAAAYALGAWSDDPERAEQFVAHARAVIAERGLDLLVSSAGRHLPSNVETVAWMLLHDVYADWRAGDLRRALDGLRSAASRAHREYSSNLARAYVTLGRLAEAERLFAGLPNADRRHEGLATVALARGDGEALRRHLAELGDRRSGFLHILAAREGLASSTELAALAADRGSPIVRGAYAAALLREGHLEEAGAVIEDVLPTLRAWAGPDYYLALESLARVQRDRGERVLAVLTLEAARGMKAQAAYGLYARPYFWLRTQAHLADLYRELGRDRDAEELESEVAALLAVADADHALLARATSR